MEDSDENAEYSNPILWPQKETDKDYIDEYNSDDDRPLFNERPHVFRIRQYGLDDNVEEEFGQGKQGKGN